METLGHQNKESARDYALKILKHNIITLKLAPGSVVNINDLAATLNLSRTPVREALMELEKIRLVEIFPQRGSQVALIDYALVEESQFLRLVLERAVVELDCQLADQLDFSGLEENISLQDYCVQNNLHERMLELDNNFHKELFRLCNKLHTYEIMNDMTAHFDRVRALALRLDIPRDRETVEDHKSLIAAIKANRLNDAQELTLQHLSRYKIDALELKKQYAFYFAAQPE